MSVTMTVKKPIGKKNKPPVGPKKSIEKASKPVAGADEDSKDLAIPPPVGTVNLFD